MVSVEEGIEAVKLARASLDDHVLGRRTPKDLPATGPFKEERGVFVTLNIEGPTTGKLRGCIGFPYPVKTLGEAIREASVYACSEDPRFLPVAPEELDSILVEVSILTSPVELTGPRKDLPSKVRIGRDGLIVSRPYTSGLLLPQVATEFGMDQAEFLSQTCSKAGLSPDAWLDPETKIQAFQTEVFAETSPRGPVARVPEPHS